MEPQESSGPHTVFIVPYRDREEHKNLFIRQMGEILDSGYQILFIHQCDNRSFNRGAMKNIGFLTVKNLYPDKYANMTLVFHDVDNFPIRKGIIPYTTVPGEIAHYYGYLFALGGIIAIKGGDFERLNGFPNFWAWGYEDNAIQMRAKEAGIKINRNIFYPIGHHDIVHLRHTNLREVNRGEFDRYKAKTTEGIKNINGVSYEIAADESNTDLPISHYIRMVNVAWFHTGTEENAALRKVHDLNNGNMPFKKEKMGLLFI